MMRENELPFLILDSVDSTNNYAMALLHSGAATPDMACFAAEQTKGKGRMGKIWETNKNENIIISIIVNASFLSVHEQFYMSAAVALSCFDFFTNYIKHSVKIKWPNDLYWNDKKTGGILIENILKGNLWQWSVIGIGININQTVFDNDDSKRASLKKITGETYDVIALAKELHKIVLSRIEEIKNNGFSKILSDYNKVLYKKNEQVKLKKGNIIFNATINEVTPEGELVAFDSMERKFKTDEVSFVL